MTLRKFGAATIATITVGAGGTFAADQAQNPYDNKGTHYELPIKSDIPQSERVEIAKHKAEMTLKGWNDEYAITITPQIPTVLLGATDRPFNKPAKRPLLSKKMEYREGNVTAFIEPKEGKENEFDIDFTLHSKPDTNVFTYKIEGAEEFNFEYQSPEYCAEPDTSCSQNVVGSYAVYHRSKANHRVGDTNYATGKAFHIYRPKAIDANSAEVWAELSYIDGKLSVAVPQKFLDDAVYPIIVDPTFGYTTVGASAGSIGNTTIYGIQNAQSGSDAGGATLTKISINGENVSSNGSVGAAIYQGGSGTKNLLSEDTGNTSTATTPADTWYDIPMSYTLSASTNYNLMFFPSQTFSISRDALSTKSVFNSSQSFETWPSSVSLTSQNVIPSIYATYSASGGGGATPQDDTYFEVLSSLILFQIAYALPRPRRELI